MTIPKPREFRPRAEVCLPKVRRDCPLPPLPDELPVGGANGHEKARSNDGLPEIEDLTTFLAKTIQRPKVLIEGLLRQGNEMILGSGSKSYKTFALLDLGLSIASGVPWLGLNTTQGKVLFVNFELKDYSIKERISDILQARGLEMKAGMFELWNLRGKAEEFGVIIPKILERIKDKEYACVILDPVYKLYGNLDENSAGDVARLMNELERVTIEAGAAIVFSAHYSKGNQAAKESMDRVSGSGVFARHPDTLLNLTRHETENSYVVEATLRDFKPMEPFVVTFEHPVMVRNEMLNAKRLKSALTKVPVFTVKDLLAVAVQGAMTTTELKEAVMKSSGMGKSTFNNLLQEFRETPGVIKNEETAKWIYNPGDGSPKLKCHSRATEKVGPPPL